MATPSAQVDIVVKATKSLEQCVMRLVDDPSRGSIDAIKKGFIILKREISLLKRDLDGVKAGHDEMTAVSPPASSAPPKSPENVTTFMDKTKASRKKIRKKVNVPLI